MKKNYKALTEAIIETLTMIGAWIWLLTRPNDTGYGNVIYFILILILSSIVSYRAIYCIGKFAVSSKEYNALREPATKKKGALIEAVIWGVIILAELIWFFNSFQIGDTSFNAVLTAVLASIAAMLIRILICVFRHRNIPLPWEKSTNKNYTALIESLICFALLGGAYFWIETLPQDTGYGGLILAVLTSIIGIGLTVRAVICLIKFVNSLNT